MLTFSGRRREMKRVCDCHRSVQDDKRPSYIHQTRRDTPACVRSQRWPVLHLQLCVQSNAFNMHIYDGETSETHTQSAGESLNWAERRGEGQRDELFNATATKWINKQMKREMASASTTPTPDNYCIYTLSNHHRLIHNNICCSSHEESISTTRHWAVFITWCLQAYLYITEAVRNMRATYLNTYN